MIWKSKNKTLLWTLAVLFVLVCNCEASSYENFFYSSKLREKRENPDSQEIEDSIANLKSQSQPSTNQHRKKDSGLKKQTAANDKTFLIPHQVLILGALQIV
jgi:hypothetical protein